MSTEAMIAPALGGVRSCSAGAARRKRAERGMTDVEYEGRRLSFAAAGSALTLHAHCVFIATERIHLGSHVMVSEFTWINAGVATQVGSFVYRANHASIAGGGVCIAGRRSGARIAACGGTRATRSRGFGGRPGDPGRGD